jgi:hypothetical protein
MSKLCAADDERRQAKRNRLADKLAVQRSQFLHQVFYPPRALGQSAVDIVAFIDRGGALLTTGLKMWVHCPFTGVISAWHLRADQSGSITVDIWKNNNAFPQRRSWAAGRSRTS